MSALKVGGILEWPSQRELGRAGLGQGAGEPQWAQEQEGLASAHCPTAWLHPGLCVPADGCPCCETGAEWGAEPAPQLLSSTPAPAAGSAETSLTREPSATPASLHKGSFGRRPQEAPEPKP